MGDILYSEPGTGTKIAAFEYLNRDSATEKIQKFQTGFQPLLATNFTNFQNMGLSGQDLYPCMTLATWTASSSGTNMYYYSGTIGLGQLLSSTSIVQVLESDSDMQIGATTTLSAGEWCVADLDSLGFETLYVRMTDNGAPASKIDAVCAQPCDGFSKLVVFSFFSVASQSCVFKPVLFPFRPARYLTDSTYMTIPVVQETEYTANTSPIDFGSNSLSENLGLYMGESFFIDIYSAEHFSIAVDTPPSSGSVSFYVGTI